MTADFATRTLASSSVLADFEGVVPNVVREAVKTTVVNEITRRAPPPPPVNGSRVDGVERVEDHDNTHDDNVIPYPYHRRFPQSQEDIDRTLSPIGEDPLTDWALCGDDDEVAVAGDIAPPTVAPLSVANDPFVLAAADTSRLSSSVRSHLVDTDHPVLAAAAAHFFSPDASPGKMVRPTMVFLVSRTLSSSPSSDAVNPSQRRLAEIAEMIHTASLFHDDVIDGSDTRRGRPSVHAAHGNKVAVLAGDFLLARASRALARLRDVTVMEAMSLVIDHLVRGEIMQTRPPTLSDDGDDDDSLRGESPLEYYLRKNFYKTGSLMAQSCLCAALLSSPDVSPRTARAAYDYGKHVGSAFQLVDDVLDLEGNPDETGKPALGDLRAGLATAPTLLALEDDSSGELAAMMARRFRYPGDVERAAEIVLAGDGPRRAKDLARAHARRAVRAAERLADVGDDDTRRNHRDALVHLAVKVVERTR